MCAEVAARLAAASAAAAAADARSSLLESQLDALYEFFLSTDRTVAPIREVDFVVGGGL